MYIISCPQEINCKWFFCFSRQNKLKTTCLISGLQTPIPVGVYSVERAMLKSSGKCLSGREVDRCRIGRLDTKVLFRTIGTRVLRIQFHLSAVTTSLPTTDACLFEVTAGVTGSCQSVTQTFAKGRKLSKAPERLVHVLCQLKHAMDPASKPEFVSTRASCMLSWGHWGTTQ